MNNSTPHRTPSRPIRPVAAALLIILLALTALLAGRQDRAAAATDHRSYLPVLHTSARTAVPPVRQGGFPLPDALCPNDIAFNAASGKAYIANEYSDNVSVLQDGAYQGLIATGDWPVWVASDPRSSRVYVSNVVSGVAIIDDGIVTGNIDPYVETYNMVINTVNDYLYITDLHRPITVVKDGARVADVFVPRFEGFQIEWQLASDFDEKTGLTYFASWQRGAMSVLDGLDVVAQFPYFGEGGNDMVIDAQRRWLTVANFRADESEQWLNNLSVVNLDTREVTAVYSAKQSRHLALDHTAGLVYATNPKNNSVTVLRGPEVVATIPVGKKPWGVTVDQRTGLAYVANSGELSVSILRDGELLGTIALPPNEGYQPYKIGVDEAAGRVYVVNRSSRDDRTPTNGRDVITCKVPWVHILE